MDSTTSTLVIRGKFSTGNGWHLRFQLILFCHVGNERKTNETTYCEFIYGVHLGGKLIAKHTGITRDTVFS